MTRVKTKGSLVLVLREAGSDRRGDFPGQPLIFVSRDLLPSPDTHGGGLTRHVAPPTERRVCTAPPPPPRLGPVSECHSSRPRNHIPSCHTHRHARGCLRLWPLSRGGAAVNTGVPVLHGGRPPVEAARDGVVTSATSAVSKAEGRRPSRRCPHLQGQHPTVRPERRGWVTVAGPGTSCRLPNTGPAMRTANRGRGRWAAACTVSSRSRGTTHPLAGPVGRGGCRAKGIPSTLSPISRARVRFVYAELGHTFTSSPAPARKPPSPGPHVAPRARGRTRRRQARG